MENSIFQERKSKIESLQKNINIINIEPKVQQPHSSLKSLFNRKHPKNRKNLKKLDIIIPNINKKNGTNKSSQRPPSIQSLITNSKTEEFLSFEKSDNYKGIKIIPLTNFSSSSTLYSVNNNNYQNGYQNNINHNSLNDNFNNFNLQFLNSAETLPKIENRKESKMSQKKKSLIEIQQEKDLKQLYQEFIDNVSNIIK